ncbi:MAG: hypothetical protein CMF12_06350 [Idiomarina sp.]|uniref:hypothetical protein n=1 Tax=Idiomarina sp. TaxID=1874361 RepID=UPI000C41C46B|nr:hypothetical protein [Idiomarina sp.]MBT42128.1 hypothetical protein [Idiomarina sp.]
MVKLTLLVLSLQWACVNVAYAGDPTRPHQWQSNSSSQSENGSAEDLQLSQIIAFGDRRYAIINGQRYQQHDTVQGFRIIAILNQRVRLQNGQQEIELTMFTPTVKRSSRAQGQEK